MNKNNKQISRILKNEAEIFENKNAFLGFVLGYLCKHFKIDGVSFFEYDAENSFLKMKLHLKNGIIFEDEENILIKEDSDLNACVFEKKPLAMRVFNTDFFYIPFTLDSHETVRINNSQTERLGFIRLEKEGRKKSFSKKEMALAENTVKELMRDLYKTEFVDLNKKYSKNILAITELTEIFATSLRVNESFKHILEGVQKYFGFDRVRLYLVDKEANKLQGKLSVDISGRTSSLSYEEIPLETGGHRLADIVLSKKRNPFFDRYTDCVLYVPLVIQGVNTGLLIVDNMLSQQKIEESEFAMFKSFAGQIALVVDNVKLFDKVEELSLYDELTKLPLRRYFQERFQEEFYRAERFKQPMALIWADVDYFKEINDTYGHQIGDKVLKEIGRVIMANLRKIDFPCRYGGDEIIVLSPQATGEEAKGLAKRLSDEIKDIRIPVAFSKEEFVKISMSIGISTFPHDANTGEVLLQKADEALYWVKSHGRGGIALYEETVKTEVRLPPRGSDNI
ncbi:MAG: sensor domain-containing diguanylate cyclase [Elusimicrobia bacterium]|nr:sensor domain-containing diguanylate cyclase [Elusimicrobiota bacterium]